MPLPLLLYSKSGEVIKQKKLKKENKMNSLLNINLKINAKLDPEFVPAAVWNKAYRELVKKEANTTD